MANVKKKRPEAYSEPSKTTKIELSATTINGSQLLAIL